MTPGSRVQSREHEANHDASNVLDRRIAGMLLAIAGAAFIAYNFVFVPRLTNNHLGDIEFSGWSGLMGSRLLCGERPYIDFVVPIPPGSFAILAAIEWVAGRPLLVQELWLNTAIHVVMGGLAYLMVVPFTSRKNAVIAAVATLVTLVQLNKECAYDHTAQCISWLSFVAAVRAFFTPEGPVRDRLWTITGALASSTLFFKQSTALGAVTGWIVALAYLMAVESVSKAPRSALGWFHDLRHVTRGIGLGLVLVWAGLIALGSTMSAFYQAVFLDASELKGGLGLLFRNVAGYLFSYPSFPASFAIITAVVLVGFRLVQKRGGLHLGDEPRRVAPSWKSEAAFIACAVAAHFALAVYFLTKGPPGYRPAWVLEIDRLKQIPTLGLLFAAAFFVVHLVRVKPQDGPLRDDTRRMGHVINAVLLASLVASIMHNMSAPEFRPFYDNNPFIPFAFMALFVAFDRADLKWLQAIVFVLILASIYGNKYHRAMTATMAAPAGTHWEGLRINDRGAVLAEAAKRARELAGPHDTVLVLPEDLELTGLVGRPRPPLVGAIVFVDQYASRLAEDDIARLADNPPKVVIVHPRRVQDWQRFFRIWSGKSGAESVMQYVLNDLLPSRYRLDHSWQTTFLWQVASLDLYVRDDRPPEERAADPDPEPEPDPSEDAGEEAETEEPQR